jgi:hypothetical protein
VNTGTSWATTVQKIDNEMVIDDKRHLFAPQGHGGMGAQYETRNDVTTVQTNRLNAGRVLSHNSSGSSWSNQLYHNDTERIQSSVNNSLHGNISNSKRQNEELSYSEHHLIPTVNRNGNYDLNYQSHSMNKHYGNISRGEPAQHTRTRNVGIPRMNSSNSNIPSSIRTEILSEHQHIPRQRYIQNSASTFSQSVPHLDQTQQNILQQRGKTTPLNLNHQDISKSPQGVSAPFTFEPVLGRSVDSVRQFVAQQNISESPRSAPLNLDPGLRLNVTQQNMYEPPQSVPLNLVPGLQRSADSDQQKVTQQNTSELSQNTPLILEPEQLNVTQQNMSELSQSTPLILEPEQLNVTQQNMSELSQSTPLVLEPEQRHFVDSEQQNALNLVQNDVVEENKTSAIEQNLRIKLRSRISLLKDSYGEKIDIPDIDYNNTSVEKLDETYRSLLVQIYSKDNFQTYYTYITIGCMCIEAIGLYYFGYKMFKNFTVHFIDKMHKYKFLLIQLGEKNILDLETESSPFFQMIQFMVFDIVIFFLIGLLTEKLGPVAGNMANNVINGFNLGSDGAERIIFDNDGVPEVPTSTPSANNSNLLGLFNTMSNMFGANTN